MNNLIAITVCVNYSDMLELAIKKNLNDLENWHIITSHKDNNTKNLCKKYNINYYITDSFYKKNCSFNKAAALNEFLYNLYHHQTLNNFEWILLLDADIILNNSIQVFTEYIDTYPNTKDYLYSCRRKIFKNEIDYLNDIGYVENINFIGYFQLFHYSKIKKDLDTNQQIFFEHNNASKYDDIFRDKYWPSRKQRIALNSVAYHLGPIATNWNGRTSQYWNILNQK